MIRSMLEPLPEAPPGLDLGLEMEYLRQHIDSPELKFCGLAAAFAKTNYWDVDGANTAIDWIRINCHMTGNAAADRVAIGERLAELTESEEACWRARSVSRT